MVMTTLSDEEMSVLSIDMDKKYWLVIPNNGQPIMASPTINIEGIENLVKKEMKANKMPKCSYRIMKHEGTIVKHTVGNRPDIPNRKTLFDLKSGDKFKTIPKYNTLGKRIAEDEEREVSGLFWIRLNEKLGYLGYIDEDGEKETMRLSPDGRDETGAIMVTF